MSILTRAFKKFGGYDKLAERYPCATEPEGTRWDHQCAEFGGTMRYDWCTTLIVAESRLYVQAGPLWQAAWQTAR